LTFGKARYSSRKSELFWEISKINCTDVKRVRCRKSVFLDF
jgi:hypothetical protein